MKKIRRSLFWRLSLFFLVTLLMFAGVFLYITSEASKEYSQEVSQNLHRSLAEWIASHTETFKEGEPDEKEIKKLFESIMTVNPAVEVYFLDADGVIINYLAPKGKVKLTKVALEPIKDFLSDEKAYIKGVDPRNPNENKIFSAAALTHSEQVVGYLYVILASEIYGSTVAMVNDSYRLKLASKSFLITLLFAIIFGIAMIWYLTKNLNNITAKVQAFKNGDLGARINMEKNKGELSQLACNIDSMADTIVENINEVKSLENLRKELIANVSHDLRTPLTAVQGYAETLVMLEDSLSEKDRRKYTERILTSTESVKKLVEDLFEISKLESQHINTNMERFSIAEMLSDIVVKYDLIAKSKDITIEFENKSEHTEIEADIGLIDRVLQNLIDNAIKHSMHGSKVIIETLQEGPELRIAVKDKGLGIPKNEIPYIFDRYKKAENNRKKGSGLGLAIVKKILELHQSEIFVESEENKGTVFSFHLPLA